MPFGGSATSSVSSALAPSAILTPSRPISIFSQPWVTLPPDVPAVADYYKAEEMWPTESLARLKVLENR